MSLRNKGEELRKGSLKKELKVFKWPLFARFL
jgi:hypothetical protein